MTIESHDTPATSLRNGPARRRRPRGARLRACRLRQLPVDTRKAVSLGLARTGKLVTSAALVLVFAFFSLSSGPGPDIKQFGIGLAAGVLIDATLIRALLVPSIMLLLGRANWWFPSWVGRALFVPAREPLPEAE